MVPGSRPYRGNRNRLVTARVPAGSQIMRSLYVLVALAQSGFSLGLSGSCRVARRHPSKCKRAPRNGAEHYREVPTERTAPRVGGRTRLRYNISGTPQQARSGSARNEGRGGKPA